MRARVITRLADVALLRSDWDELVDDEQLDVSATYDWSMALLESHLDNNGLTVIVVEDDAGKLMGIFPFYLKHKTIRKLPVKVICPIAQLFCIHHDLLIRDGRQDILKLIFDQLNSIPGVEKWNAVELPEVECGCYTDRILTSFLATNNYKYIFSKGSSSPFIKLGGISWEGYLKSLKKNVRKNFKRRINNFEKEENLSIKQITDYCEIIKIIHRIENNSWKHKCSSSIVDKKQQKIFYEKIIDKFSSVFMLFVLFFGDEPISYSMGLSVKGKYYSLKTSFDEAYDKLSPGIMLKLELLQYCFKNEFNEFDLCGRDEQHKKDFADDVRNHNNYLIFNKDMYSQLTYAVSRFTSQNKRNA